MVRAGVGSEVAMVLDDGGKAFSCVFSLFHLEPDDLSPDGSMRRPRARGPSGKHIPCRCGLNRNRPVARRCARRRRRLRRPCCRCGSRWRVGASWATCRACWCQSGLRGSPTWSCSLRARSPSAALGSAPPVAGVLVSVIGGGGGGVHALAEVHSLALLSPPLPGSGSRLRRRW